LAEERASEPLGEGERGCSIWRLPRRRRAQLGVFGKRSSLTLFYPRRQRRHANEARHMPAAAAAIGWRRQRHNGGAILFEA